MSISVEVFGQIRRSYLEGKSQAQIARELDVSRNTVRKYCNGDNVPWDRKVTERASPVMTDETDKFILACLEEDEKEDLKKQKHTARRIYERLVEEKGYTGGESTVRRKVRELKGCKAKVFIPLAFEPGEAMQVDWGEAKIYECGIKIKISFFCARLCFSCKPIVFVYRHQNEESFLDAFVRIFSILQGVPKKVIFDNARVAVKEGFGALAKKQAGYTMLSAHYGFQAVFCNPASGHEKGLVEGLVGWARRNILVPVPRVERLEDLNEILQARCLKYAKQTIAGKPKSVREMFEEEQRALQPLPSFPFETAKSQNARVSATSTVRFQTNEYSVPSEYVGYEVGIKAYPETVEIYSHGKKIAEHRRLWGKHEKSCRLVDYLSLLEERGRAVLNALPVKQNLSEEAYNELKANIGDPQKVREILRREAGLQAEELKEGADKHQLSKDERLKIKEVNLRDYDALLKGDGE